MEEEEKFVFKNFKDRPISQTQWNELSKLLFHASREDEEGERLRTLFEKRGDENKEEKLQELRKYSLQESDLNEIHQYLESIFHDSPLKFWWW